MAIQSPTIHVLSAARQYEVGLRSRILSTAKTYLGTPYKLGGKAKDGGIDCSGFVTNVLLTALDSQKFKPLVQNIALLRTSPVLQTIEQPEDGDIVLWNGHGGIVFNAAKGEFIGAQTSTGVDVASYRTGHWTSQPGIMFRRFGSYFYEWSKSFLAGS